MSSSPPYSPCSKAYSPRSSEYSIGDWFADKHAELRWRADMAHVALCDARNEVFNFDSEKDEETRAADLLFWIREHSAAEREFHAFIMGEWPLREID